MNKGTVINSDQPFNKLTTANKETKRYDQTQISFSDLIEFWVSLCLKRRAIPHPETKLNISKLPIEISFVIASKSMKKAGTATAIKTIHDPQIGIRVSGSNSQNILGIRPSSA